MWLKDRFLKKITMTVLQRQCMIIVTLLSTLLLIKVWPRFRSDAFSVNWQWYIVLILIFFIPLVMKPAQK